jgi:catechol 2,3-dioxygenase-like lactoylglutathione lyase family enzyme
VQSRSAQRADAEGEAAVLGRFLEISTATTDIAASLAFYETLGFTQLSVNETWPHPYAVVTDGRLFLGLHQTSLPSPLLTYVQPDLALRLPALQRQGISFESVSVGETSFNEARFLDPTGYPVRMIEARTFSLGAAAEARLSNCGYFSEFALPAPQFENASRFWEPLGFVALEPSTQPFARMTLTSDTLNIGLYRSRAFRTPLLVFEDEQMAARLELLRERGFVFTDEMPDALDYSSNAVLTAPDGLKLLLLQSEA